MWERHRRDKKKIQLVSASLKELPTVRNKTEKTDKKRVGVWSGIAAGAAGCILAAVYMGDAHTDLAVSNGEKITGEDIKTDTGTDIETIETDVETTKTGSETTELGVEMTETDMGKDKRANREAEVRSDRDGDTENEERKKDTADADEVKKNVTDESGKTDAAAEWMELYLDQHTDSGNQKAIEIGEKARLSVLWKLADAYERSGNEDGADSNIRSTDRMGARSDTIRRGRRKKNEAGSSAGRL